MTATCINVMIVTVPRGGEKVNIVMTRGEINITFSMADEDFVSVRDDMMAKNTKDILKDVMDQMQKYL